MNSEKERKRENRKEFVLMLLMCSIAGIVFFGGMFLAGRFTVNEVFNLAYRNGYYFDRSGTTLVNPDVPEGYIAYYNTGNHDFQNGRYQEAMDNYMKALELSPPHEHAEEAVADDEECNVRVNLALSILYQIDFENLHLNDRVEVDQAAEQLLIAREVLTTDDCAHFDNPYGHNADAEQLKKEIDEILRRLDRTPPPPQSSSSGGDDEEEPQPSESDENEDEQSRRERELEKKLNEEMSDAKEQQMEAERRRERERDGGGGYEYGYGLDPEVQSW